ncbi:uncharacterized protein LOC109605213 [Aethina tumida]|uniref:uncharacterized protein LOC109605213 n=1 Tax=Aethina tumida TaxID=116153 RepID=UPI00096B1A04|nr:uncharacterized protein LOC109605213 [Aethina tumida]
MWAVVVAVLWGCVVATPQPLHLKQDSFGRPTTWQKRLSEDPHSPTSEILAHHIPQINSANSQLMLRSPRGSRQYDVPQIECPPAADGMERFACPTPDLQGRYHCIDDHVLCDGFIDCPSAEDENRQACMFYKTTKAHLDVIADALLRWARGR